MTRNGKQMKLEATRLTEAQRCEIIVKLSKLNAVSKRALGREYEVCEGVIRKVIKTMRVEEEPPIDDKIQPIKTLGESESATNFKGFNVLNMNDQLLHSRVQTKAGHMYDEMRRSFETFQQNVNRVTLNVKCKKTIHSRQMTLTDVFKQ